MAAMDEALVAMLASIEDQLKAANLVRVRGGLSRGASWAEASGRATDGSWLEMRLHHRATESRLQAGLLAYRPLSRGGRTVVLGESSRTYRNGPEEVAQDVADEVVGWLSKLEGQ